MKISSLPSSFQGTISSTPAPKIDGTNTNGTNTPKLTDGSISPPSTPRPPIGPKPTFFNVGQYVLDRIEAALAKIERLKDGNTRTPPGRYQ